VASPGILEIPEVFFRVFGKMCFDQDVVASPEILEIPEVFFRVFGIPGDLQHLFYVFNSISFHGIRGKN
jgi:hypothetical protein